MLSYFRCGPALLGLLAIVGLLALMLAPRTARAQSDEIAVSLTIDPCVNVDAREAERLFALELGTSVPGAVQSNTPDATKIDATCEGELVVLRVRDPLTGKELTRRISLGPKGRERLLALAVMELVVASWIELETTPTPAVPAADSRAADASKQRARTIAKRRLPVARPRARAARVTTTLIGAVSVGSVGVASGGGIRVTYDGGSGLGWAADMIALRSSDDLALGSVAVRAVGGSAAVHWHQRIEWLRLRAAVGARLAAVTMTGTPDDPEVTVGDQLEGMAGGAFARISVSARVLNDLTVELSAEPGFHVLPVRGTVDGSKQTSVDGTWLTGDLAVGWSW